MLAFAHNDVPWIFVELGAAVIGLALLAPRSPPRLLGDSALLARRTRLRQRRPAPVGDFSRSSSTSVPKSASSCSCSCSVWNTPAEEMHQPPHRLRGRAWPISLNFSPGIVAGLLLAGVSLASVLLGGVTYISSSGIVARVLAELKAHDCPETPTVLSILVLEDLAMAVFLPLVAVLLVGQGFGRAGVGLHRPGHGGGRPAGTVRYGQAISQILSRFRRGHLADHVRTGVGRGRNCPRLQVSAAVGAFLVGMALAGRSSSKHTAWSAPCATRSPLFLPVLRSANRPGRPATRLASGGGIGNRHGADEIADRLVGCAGPGWTRPVVGGPGPRWSLEVNFPSSSRA